MDQQNYFIQIFSLKYCFESLCCFVVFFLFGRWYYSIVFTLGYTLNINLTHLKVVEVLVLGGVRSKGIYKYFFKFIIVKGDSFFISSHMNSSLTSLYHNFTHKLL
jgi:hypothetical protein